MSVITQLPEQLDSNVTINPPSVISIDYRLGSGWYITLDRIIAKTTNNLDTIYWDNATEAMDWLIERDLVKTKAYTVLANSVKKASKKNKN